MAATHLTRLHRKPNLRHSYSTCRARISEGNRLCCMAGRIWTIRCKLQEVHGYNQTTTSNDAIAKPVPSHSLRQTAQGAKRKKIRGLAGGEASSNDLVTIVMTAA